MARRARTPTQKKADAKLGKRLAQIRKDQGFTQVELAEDIGSIQAIISDYERGRLRPHPEMLVKLAKALRVSADEILGISTPKKSEKSLSRRFLRRMRALEALPKRDQDAVLRTIDAFLTARNG